MFQQIYEMLVIVKKSEHILLTNLVYLICLKEEIFLVPGSIAFVPPLSLEKRFLFSGAGWG